MLGELHVGFFERTAEAADAVAVLADIFAFGFVEDVANVSAGETAGLDECDEVLDEVLEENIVFPEGVVGVDEESIASHYFLSGRIDLNKTSLTVSTRRLRCRRLRWNGPIFGQRPSCARSGQCRPVS